MSIADFGLNFVATKRPADKSLEVEFSQSKRQCMETIEVGDKGVLCRCNKPAKHIQVKKEGPTKGRFFYACGEYPKACDHFSWADGTNKPKAAGKSNFSFSFSNTSHGEPHGAPHGAPPGVKKCDCNRPAKMMEVKKEGPSKGRKFFTCHFFPKVCKMFDWATSVPSVEGMAEVEEEGPNPESMLPDPISKESMLKFLNVTPEQAMTIQAYPQRSSEWLKARVGRLTASNFGWAAGYNPYGSPEKLVAEMLWKKFKGNAACRWGTYYESLAIAEYTSCQMKKIGLSNIEALRKGYPVSALEFRVEERGLIVNPEMPWMGVSPDGIVFTRSESAAAMVGVLEIKCPKAEKVYEKQPQYSVSKYPGIPAGIPPQYYCQIVGIMANLKLSWADFVVWTPTEMTITRYQFDSEFWEKTLFPKLEHFYFNLYLPALDLKKQGKLQPNEIYQSLDISL
jgi:hypothetical protein